MGVGVGLLGCHTAGRQVKDAVGGVVVNRRSWEIQGTALGKCLRTWSGIINRSMPAGVAQSRHAFVGGTLSTWGR